MFKKEEKTKKKPAKKKKEKEAKESHGLGEMIVAPALFIVTVVVSYLIYSLGR